MAWTDDRIDLLRTMWLAGSSASQIAAVLGEVTRNAVIGKVHRLGLSGRGKPTSTATPRARKPRAQAGSSAGAAARPLGGNSAAMAGGHQRRTSTSVHGGMAISLGATALKPSEDIAEEQALVPDSRGRADLMLVGESPRLSIQELKEDTCRWPMGDPMKDDFHFCGRSALDSQPYCEYHCSVAFQAPSDRRRERSRS